MLYNSRLKPSDKPLRKTPMPHAKKPMPRQSADMKAAKAAQRAVYAGIAQQVEVKRCLACRTTYGLQHSHILTQGNHQHQRANPLNIVYLCSDLSNGCHTLWEHHKAEFARRYPHAYAEKLRRMALIDPAATRFFLRKNPAPAAATNPLLYPDD